eukprot:TRINITY_DN16069_c0_g1_i2.p1 TRINITY_DN16069_c0_g1~~TRINITY_DN16069_c0_g1_i2.p1  ORF type:complete len:255 (-),score=45.46 TRINITY_DN16069_c0_g1_i2:25-789(-)
MNYYAKKRFKVEGLGVTQPSQKKYIYYFYEIFKNQKITPTLKYIDKIVLTGVPRFDGNTCKPYFTLQKVKTNEQIYTHKQSHASQATFEAKGNDSLEQMKLTLKMVKQIPIAGDILLNFHHNGKILDSFMFRFSFNTAFIPDNNLIKLKLEELDPDSTVKDKRFPESFNCEIYFLNICKCSNQTPFDKKCAHCLIDLIGEQQDWGLIHEILKNYQPPNWKQSKILVFGDQDFDDVDEVLKEFEPIFNQPSQQQS